MKTTILTRSFILKDNKQSLTLADPGEELSPHEVMDIYSIQHPQLTTASLTGPEIINDQRVYTFSTILGTKG